MKLPAFSQVRQSQQGILVDPEDEDGVMTPSLGRLRQSRHLVVDDSEDEGDSQDPRSTPTRPHPHKPALMLPHPNRPSQTPPTSTPTTTDISSQTPSTSTPTATHTPSQTPATSNPTTAMQVLTDEEDNLQIDPPTPSKRPRKSTPQLPKPDTPQMTPKLPKPDTPPPPTAPKPDIPTPPTAPKPDTPALTTKGLKGRSRIPLVEQKEDVPRATQSSASFVEAGPHRRHSAGNNKRKADDQSTRASKKRCT
jgi:hypothetical protein